MVPKHGSLTDAHVSQRYQSCFQLGETPQNPMKPVKPGERIRRFHQNPLIERTTFELMEPVR